MKWVEVKMRELGVLGADDWKVTCMLDHQAMLTVTTERYGTFDCKPLQFLWSKFRCVRACLFFPQFFVMFGARAPCFNLRMHMCFVHSSLSAAALNCTNISLQGFLLSEEHLNA